MDIKKKLIVGGDMSLVIKEVIEKLEDFQMEITIDNVKSVINKWIENLYSHIGKEAHEYSLICDVADETGMTWEEQDNYMLQKINEYRKCLSEIESKGIILENIEVRNA